MTTWSPLLDVPAYPTDGYAGLADRLAAVLHTRNDVLLVQGEAIVALEAVANSVATADVHALNIVTSPYGSWFGGWLRRSGADVTDVVADPAMPIRIEAVASALEANPGIDLVSLVHAESASGIRNPLPEIASLARAQGALLVVDAVASVGGHRLDVDALGIDIAVIGAQKSLGGSSGIAAISLSQAAWDRIDRPDAPVLSTLSLLDLKRDWLDKGRGVQPGMPSALEFHALAAALDRVEAEGLEAIIARHALAGQASREGLLALGVFPFVDHPLASDLVTTAPLPEGIAMEPVLAHPASRDAELTAGVGPGAERLLRLNHTGRRARYDIVLANVMAVGRSLRALDHRVDLAGAAEAVAKRYAHGI